MKNIILAGLTLTLLAGPSALAHPHNENVKEKPKAEWPFFGTKEKSKVTVENDVDGAEALTAIERLFSRHAERMSRDMEKAKRRNKGSLSKLEDGNFFENPEDLMAAAKALERMFDDSDILENMASLAIDLADNIDVEAGDNKMTLRFDGKTLGSINVDRDGEINENFEIEGLGRNMNVEKEVVIRNGKKRTRIVIEMDAIGDDD